MMILYLLVYAPLNILSFLGADKFRREYSMSYSLFVFIGRNGTKVPLDIYFFAIFISNFVYLIWKKAESLAAKDR